MKLFLVDVHNAIDMSHYGTFFYENINKGNISVFSQTADSLKSLGSVLSWINEEINRNPFSIDNAVVVFFLSRDFTEPRKAQDYEIFSKMYIDELLARNLDRRFRYVCFYLDHTGRDASDDRVYREIAGVDKSFCSDDPALKDSFLPAALPDGDRKETVDKLIRDLPDSVTSAFFRRVYDLVVSSEIGPEEQNKVENWYGSVFLNQCSQEIADIKSFTGAYYSSDISQKIETVLKVVKYVCSFADGYDPENEFDNQLTAFLNKESYDRFSIDMDEIRELIATYKKRLSSWEPAESDAGKEEIPTFSFQAEDHAEEFEKSIEGISTSELQNALKPSVEELSTFDPAESVFAYLDILVREADKRLKAFCEARIAEMREFRKQCEPTVIERADGIDLSEDEQKEELDSAAAMNQYTQNELPGYAAELKLRQQLELSGRKLRRIGSIMNAAKKTAFIVCLLFAVLSIGAFYLGLQHSVFAKENTWIVFGVYLAAFTVLFAGAYAAVRSFFKRKASKELNECRKMVKEFLNNYISRAREFEANLNAAISHYCVVDKNNKSTVQRHDQTDFASRREWHRNKIKVILQNLAFFDALVKGTSPIEEGSVPKLDLFKDDAVHSEFYQMRVFR